MKGKIKRNLTITGVLFLVIITYAAWQVFSTVEFDMPSGPYAVGTFGVEITDSSRTENLSPNEPRSRHLLLQFWYPAEKISGLKKAKYHPNPDVFLSDVSKLFPDIPQLFLKRLANATTNAYTNAPLSVAENNYPAIIFSHGMDGMRFLNTCQMEELASHGYIVASIEHTFSASGTVFSDGSKGGVTPYELMENEDFGNAMVDKWSADQVFAINYLEKINNDPRNFFYGKLDVGKIGILGFHLAGRYRQIRWCWISELRQA